MIKVPAFLLATLVATGCASTPPDPEDFEDGFVVPAGKEDDFFSLTASEFVVEGRSTVTVEEGAGADRAKELIGLKHISIAWFLNQYLVDKEEEDANHAYGGLGAMVKSGSYQDLDIVQLDERTYEFTFSQVLAGDNALMSKLPVHDGAFSIEIGRPSNEEMARLETNEEWYRQAPWEAWDPSKVDASRKETLALSVREERRSSDAWWDFDRLFADGKLDIDVYFGWDYHDAYHLKHSRALYLWLKQQGFRSPVSSFDKYTRESGPLTKRIRANGKDVSVEVRIIYGKPGTDTDPDTDAGGIVLENEARASLKTRDVVIYSGHSGPFYGFALANWKKTDEGDLDDTDIVSAEMPSDRYQIVMANGCDTYMIGEAFRLNPDKQGHLIDVITSTSFSNAGTPSTVEDFVTRLIEQDSSGRHRPRTVGALLENIDEAADEWGYHTMYGVHGIDDNPTLHPYARVENLCNACSRNSDCGGVGNACIADGDGDKHCAAACTADSGCPDGYTCQAVASASAHAIYARMCVPRDLTCR